MATGALQLASRRLSSATAPRLRSLKAASRLSLPRPTPPSPSPRRTYATTNRPPTTHFLNTGATIPAIGVGTFQDGALQESAVAAALRGGVRLVDTAAVYGVEREVGQGLRASGVPREEVFLGTKLWCNDAHPDDAERALDASLERLGTGYVDLWMMHYPCVFRRGVEQFPRGEGGRMAHGETDFVDAWRAMERVVKRTGKARAIGVCNFSQGEIQRLLDECSVVPAVHQMEVHPYLQQRAFNAWLRARGIHVVQFSPLGNMNDFYRQTGWSKAVAHSTPRLTEQPLLQELGRKYGDKSAVQIALAWGVACGRSVIPKSTVDWQIRENVEAGGLALEAADVEAIAALDAGARFNDPSLDYGWRLYADLEGIEGTMDGFTH